MTQTHFQNLFLVLSAAGGIWLFYYYYYYLALSGFKTNYLTNPFCLCQFGTNWWTATSMFSRTSAFTLQVVHGQQLWHIVRLASPYLFAVSYVVLHAFIRCLPHAICFELFLGMVFYVVQKIFPNQYVQWLGSYTMD